MRLSPCPALFSLLLSLTAFDSSPAQIQSIERPTTALTIGTPVERTLSGGQSHNYTVALDPNQFAQLVVDQHGIDVIVRVFSPDGKKLGEFDSPNGDQGAENVSFVARDAGVYRVEVAPLGQAYNPPPGKYEIKLTEVRKATEEELRAGSQQDELKPKARALVTEALDLLPQVHRPETRAGFQMKAGQMLWDSDQKRAAKLFEQATESLKELIRAIDPDDADYSEGFRIVQQLRQEMLNALTPLDAEMALDMLRSTRGLAPPANERVDQRKIEQGLEIQLIGQLATRDPRRSFEMAEDSLKSGTSDGLANVIYQLAKKDPELGLRLAHDIVAKLQTERFFQTPQSGYLAINLLNAAHQPLRIAANGANSTTYVSPDDTRDLFQKMVAEALAYDAPRSGGYDDKRNLAQNLITTLQRLTTDLEAYAADKKAALDEKLTAVRTTGNLQQDAWTKYQNSINQGSNESALESIGAAPEEMRSSLYQQLASRLIQSGDTDGARAILTQRISDPHQRQDAIHNLDRQAIFVAVSKGRIDEAVRLLTNLRPARDRVQIIGDVVTRIGPGLKRAMAIGYLDQLSAMLDSGKAADQTQMYARLQLARAFARYDAGRAFDSVDPLLNQFNELAAAAVVMNGFNERYYREGELISNGNAIASLANQLSNSLAGLGLMNFDRAKAMADRVAPLDIRLLTYFTIAQLAMRETRGGVVDF
jgi:hypothetical protein